MTQTLPRDTASNDGAATTTTDRPTDPTRLTATDERLAPDPQFRRAGWVDLNGEWEFAFDDDNVGLEQGWARGDRTLDRTITVPFPPESSLSGIGDTSFHEVIWYARTIELGRVAASEAVLLHFGAVDHACQLFVNGAPAGQHVGGMTRFSVDITQHLVAGPTQRIVLRVVDDPRDLAQPRGKQDWRTETHGIFYERTSGIWQPVWLERVSRVHLTSLAWTADLVRAEVTADLELSAAPPSGSSVTVRLRHDDDELAYGHVAVTGRHARVTIHLPVLQMPMDRGRLLWTPERPVLIDATVELAGPDGPLDRVDSYLGLRSVGYADGRFLLNGHPYYLRMVLEQGYWPESHLASPSEDALRREVELIKELGFNGARIHQKVEDPRFLYWCDRLGLAVWGEMANSFVYTERSATLLLAEWPEVIKRDRSHPSIVAWIPINESWGVPNIATDVTQQHFATAMYHLTKALDPTRPTVSNEGWEITEADIWGIHDYTPSADGIRARYSDAGLPRTLTDRGPGRRRVLLGNPEHRGQPIMITEFGGLSYAPSSGERWFGYSTITTDEEFRERLASLITAIAEQPGLAGFCYTQLTDTLQESNGLLRADRSPKLPIETIREIVTTPSAAIPTEEIDTYRRAAQRAADTDDI